jgi:hypothetical protein
MFAWAFNSSILAAADSAGPFTIKELQQLLASQFGSKKADQMMWALSPFEYLARHGHNGDRLFVGSMPVSALLPYIPVVLEHCRDLIDLQRPQDASVLAKSAAKLSERLLTVLTVPAVQQGLGGLQQLQPSIAVLESAQETFKQHVAAAAASISRQNDPQHSQHDQWGPACGAVVPSEPAGQSMQQQTAPAHPQQQQPPRQQQQQHPIQAPLRCAGNSCSPAVAAVLSVAQPQQQPQQQQQQQPMQLPLRCAGNSSSPAVRAAPSAAQPQQPQQSMQAPLRCAGNSSSPAAAAALSAAQPEQQQQPMQASHPRPGNSSSAAIAAALSAAVGFVPAPATDSGKDLRLAALLGAAAQYSNEASGVFPPCFTALLATWASLVYGEFAATSSIQVRK